MLLMVLLSATLVVVRSGDRRSKGGAQTSGQLVILRLPILFLRLALKASLVTLMMGLLMALPNLAVMGVVALNSSIAEFNYCIPWGSIKS